MAEGELNVDSLISRLLEGKYSCCWLIVILFYFIFIPLNSFPASLSVRILQNRKAVRHFYLFIYLFLQLSASCQRLVSQLASLRSRLMFTNSNVRQLSNRVLKLILKSYCIAGQLNWLTESLKKKKWNRVMIRFRLVTRLRRSCIEFQYFL